MASLQPPIWPPRPPSYKRVENDTIVLCTTSSFKGDDAEIVVIADIEQFVAQKEILPHHLLVAMTRARSLFRSLLLPPASEGRRRSKLGQ
jgi:hypothetical protein